MKCEIRPWNQMLSTLALVSRIPIPSRWYQFDASRVDVYLPLVGLIPSLALAGFLQLSRLGNPEPMLFALVFLIPYYFLFNLFHFDGLLDTADAFLGTIPKEKREAILKDPRVGVYGLWVGVVYLVTKLYFFQKIGEQGFSAEGAWGYFFFLSFPISSRTAAAVLPALFSPARKEGLGALVQGGSLWRALGGYLGAEGFLLGVASILWGIPTLSMPMLLYAGLLLVLPFTVAGWVGHGYQKNLGGYTGDALGAAIELTELFHLGIIFFLSVIQL